MKTAGIIKIIALCSLAVQLAGGCGGTPVQAEKGSRLSAPPPAPSPSPSPLPTSLPREENDYRRLRMTYTFSPAYDPYDQQVVRLDRKLFSLLREERWDEARQAAEKLVKLSRLDIRGHIFLDLINRRLGEEKRADYHRELARGLLDSIFASGDGRSSATALKVISPREEEAVCLVLGLEKEEQVLDAVDGRMIDRAICVDPETGNKTTLFFDITIPYQWAREKLTDE